MSSNLGKLALFIGGAVLVFVIGALAGGWVIARRLSPAQPVVAFVTPTPGAPALPLPPAPTPIPGGCLPPPANWGRYTVQPGDTLSELAARTGVDLETVRQVNCLPSLDLMEGQTLYLPLVPTPTPCLISPPAGWGPTLVQAGDTLTDLAGARGVSVAKVMQVNCLPAEDIVAGQQLYLPVLPTPTPCLISPPSGWGPTMVQAGDTLTGLAGAHGVSVAKVMQVNCLPSADITAGQTLYLPLLPTATPAPTESPPTSTPPLQPTSPALPTLMPQTQAFSPASNQQPTGPQTLPLMGWGMGTGQVQGGGIVINPELEPVGFAAWKPSKLAVCNNEQLIPIYDNNYSPTPNPERTPDISALDLHGVDMDEAFKDNSTLDRLYLGNPWECMKKPCTTTPTPNPENLLNEFIDKNFKEGGLVTPQQPLEVHPGEVITIYVCNFRFPHSIMAWITDDNGLRHILLSEGYYLPLGQNIVLNNIVDGTAIWNIPCDLPLGEYILTVQYEVPNPENPSDPKYNLVKETHIRIVLEETEEPKILIMPRSGRAGSSFEVNYCNYEPFTQFVLYHKERFNEQNRKPGETFKDEELIWQPVATWTITTNDQGWAKQNLRSAITDPLGEYVIALPVSPPSKIEPTILQLLYLTQ